MIRLIELVTPPARVACDEMVAQFGAYPLLLGIVGTIVLLGAIIFALTTGFLKMGDGFNGAIVFISILTVVAIGVLIIVGIVILGILCALF